MITRKYTCAKHNLLHTRRTFKNIPDCEGINQAIKNSSKRWGLQVAKKKNIRKKDLNASQPFFPHLNSYSGKDPLYPRVSIQQNSVQPFGILQFLVFKKNIHLYSIYLLNMNLKKIIYFISFQGVIKMNQVTFIYISGLFIFKRAQKNMHIFSLAVQFCII